MKYERYYFYYVDFEGKLYHEHSLIEDKKFLNFFFKNLNYNKTGDFYDYPYLSPCGKEMNFISCPDTPIVFRRMENQELIYGGDLKITFEPERVVYVEITGQLYHPVNHLFGRIGKNLLIELSYFIIEKDNKFYFNNKEILRVSSFSELIPIKK